MTYLKSPLEDGEVRIYDILYFGKFTVNAVPDNAIVIWHHPKDGKIVC